jgi:hypothetical protein
LTGHHLLHLVTDSIDVPVGDQPLARVDGLERTIGKGAEITPVNRIREVSDRLSTSGFFLPERFDQPRPEATQDEKLILLHHRALVFG